MNKPYILSPAGSYDALLSAVNGGADEVYFGFGEFNARQNAGNFTPEQMKQAIELCRILGVKTNITVNTLVTDKEMPSVLDLVYKGACFGADAFIVQDLGLAQQIKKEMPSVCLHASTQCACHNSEGAKRLQSLGFDRVVLAREMPKEEIEKVVKLGIETEIFVHGALCVCHSGMCLMSSVIGKRSGNRGLCAQPCRMEYHLSGMRNKSYPLSLKDSCLGTRVEDILDMGVTSLKIEGRMKSPDYVYNTTKIWREIIDGGKNASDGQMKSLENIFSRGGFTDKYFTGAYVKDNSNMYGVRSESDKENTRVAEKQNNEVSERKRPITLKCVLEEWNQAKITLSCGDVSVEYASDFLCESAKDKPMSADDIKTSLTKMGTTHFYCEKAEVEVHGNIFVPKSYLNALRRNAVELLEQKLVEVPELQRIKEAYDIARNSEKAKKDMTLFASCENLRIASNVKDMKYVSVPVEEFIKFDGYKEKCVENIKNGGAIFGIRLPRVIFDSEVPELERLVKLAVQKGAQFAEISNIGHIDACKKENLKLVASVGMNVFNSFTVDVLSKMGFSLICASAELNEAQIRDLSRVDGVEMCAFVKGRLPLMVLESCVVKANTGCKNCDGVSCGVLKDRIGKEFMIFGEKRLNEKTSYKPCRNIVVNSVEADILSSDEKISKMNVDTGLIYIWE